MINFDEFVRRLNSVRNSAKYKELISFIACSLAYLSDEDQHALYDSFIASCFRVLHLEEKK